MYYMYVTGAIAGIFSEMSSVQVWIKTMQQPNMLCQNCVINVIHVKPTSLQQHKVGTASLKRRNGTTHGF